MKGFYNRLLFIDVGEKTFTVQPIEDDLLKKCLGGKGLASFLLLAHNPARVDPLGPDNRLIFRDRTGCRQFGVGFLPARCLHQVSADRFLL